MAPVGYRVAYLPRLLPFGGVGLLIAHLCNNRREHGKELLVVLDEKAQGTGTDSLQIALLVLVALLGLGALLHEEHVGREDNRQIRNAHLIHFLVLRHTIEEQKKVLHETQE